MFCPRCAAKNDIGQKYCRACGLHLEETALSVREQLGDSELTTLSHQEEKLDKFGTFAFTGFGIVIGLAVLGIMYAILTRMVLSGSQPLFGILLLAFILFGALCLSYVFWNETLEERRKKLRSSRASKEIRGTPTTGKLLNETSFEPISVTEKTTDLLTKPVKKL